MLIDTSKKGKSFDRHLAFDQFRMTVHHILSRPDMQWTGDTGYIRGELLQRLLPPLPPKTNPMETLVCVCGPTAFSKLANE